MSTTEDIKHEGPARDLHGVIRERWSPYAWADRDVADADLRALFEAARWAPSCYNEQPWRYLVARRRDEATFARMLECLVEGNQAWARQVPVLALGVIATTFARNGGENGWARHDLGLASANLSAEATARGIRVHQMAGILPDRARELFAIPEGFEAHTGIAIGYPDPTSDNERDRTPRSRRALEETLFEGQWGRPASL